MDTLNIFLNNFEVMQDLNMTFNKVDFILTFEISFSGRTLQLRSLLLLQCIFIHLSPESGQHQTPNIGQTAHFLLQFSSHFRHGWGNLHLLRSFQGSNVPVNFFKFLSIEFAACSKPPSRDSHRKVSYPRMQ